MLEDRRHGSDKKETGKNDLVYILLINKYVSMYIIMFLEHHLTEKVLTCPRIAG